MDELIYRLMSSYEQTIGKIDVKHSITYLEAIAKIQILEEKIKEQNKPTGHQ